MKKLSNIILCFLLILLTVGCSQNIESPDANDLIITDDLGNSFAIRKNPDVVSCYGSYAECWLLAGGKLVGVTNDAIDEHHLELDNDTKNIGTVKEINLELLTATQPDYIILSADLTAHLNLKQSLDALGLKYGFFKVDTFEDYKNMMQKFCALTMRDDLFEKNVSDVESRINAIKNKIPKHCDKTVLLMRAFSTGIKAKTNDNLAGCILEEFGVTNIADKYPSLLEDLSTEQIIREDPDFIFSLTMGNQQAAINFLKENVESNAAWNDLKAVKNNKYIILPKDLFHYKPNNRWDKSYEYIAKIIFPKIFS